LLAGRDALFEQARSLLPALRVVAAGAVVLALLAGAFVAGRSSSPASAAPAAPATTAPSVLTLPGGRVLSGNIRDFGWRADHGEVSLTLRTVLLTGDNTSITFEVAGLEPGWSVVAVRDLRVLDAQGRELALNSVAQDLPAFRSRAPAAGVGVATIALQHRIDPGAVAQVSVGRLVLAQQFEERLVGTLVDADLKRRTDQTQPGQQDQVAGPASCPSCSLQVRCDGCQTIRMAGAAYRHGQVTLLLASTEPAGGETLAQADIVVSAASGQIGSMDTTVEGDTMVSFDGRDLAATTDPGQARMSFEVMAMINRARVAAGPWRIDERSGSR